MLSKILLIVISSIFINNVIVSRFLGICPFIGVSKKLDTALGMGLSVTFVMTLSTMFCYLIQNCILVPLGIDFLQTLVFILVIASLVQMVEIVLKKVSYTLYSSLGIYLPLITTNCAILGIAILAVSNPEYGFLESVVFSFASSLGFILAILIFASLREKLESATIAKCFKNVPIAFITAGILALAFMGFSGLV